MKLLFCQTCWDVVKLDYELRKCKCGNVVGRYLPDGRNAEVNGQGLSLAIDNNALSFVLLKGEVRDKEDVYCWARPHEGILNPHTTVVPNLGKEEK